LAVIEFGKADLGVCVDDSLLIDPADALQGIDVKGILRAAIAGAFALELAMRLLVGLGLLERGDLGLGQQDAILRHLGFERLEAMLDTIPQVLRIRSCHLMLAPSPSQHLESQNSRSGNPLFDSAS